MKVDKRKLSVYSGNQLLIVLNYVQPNKVVKYVLPWLSRSYKFSAWTCANLWSKDGTYIEKTFRRY